MTEENLNDSDKIDRAAKEREQRVKESSANLFINLKQLLRDVYEFIKELMSLKDETDYEGTRLGIVKDVTFRGPTVYILICSIFIASIGLNLNSPAVIIGAMLIAPLMGPILGVGLAFGTNDAELLGKSLKYFGVMIIISLVTSTLYFLLTPLVEHQPELLSRTRPTTLDILVAIFGGAAGIVAGSRKEKSNVIPGVAIATALMPPLCTSGFGLATGNWPFFFGAFYLFMLNSIFICVSTIVGVRYLGFPMKKFVNKVREKKVKTWMAIVMTIIIIPSLWILYGVVRESVFKSHAEKFVVDVAQMQGARMVDKKYIYSDTVPSIELFMIGREIPEDTIKKWQNLMADYKLTGVKLDVYGMGDSQNDQQFEAMTGKLKETIQADVVQKLYSLSREDVLGKDEQIRLLEKELLKLQPRDVKMAKMAKELKIQFENLERMSYADTYESNFDDKVDTIPTILVKWKSGIPRSQLNKDQKKIEQLMKLRLELDTVRVLQY